VKFVGSNAAFLLMRSGAADTVYQEGGQCPFTPGFVIPGDLAGVVRVVMLDQVTVDGSGHLWHQDHNRVLSLEDLANEVRFVRLRGRADDALNGNAVQLSDKWRTGRVHRNTRQLMLPVWQAP
jgi:hypothetical protein